MTVFYKITAENGQQSYLFGTLHMDDKKITLLPKEVRLALEQAKTFVCEADITNGDFAVLRAEIEWKKRHSREHHNWKFAQSNVQYEANRLEKHFPSNMQHVNIISLVENKPPLQLFSIVRSFSMPQTQSSKVLDMQLARHAEKNNKHMFFLESPVEQVKKLIGFELTYGEQREAYNDCINDFSAEKVQENVKKIKQAYLNGNLDLLNTMTQVDSNAAESMKKYIKNSCTGRDILMAHRMIDELQKGDAFIAVGVLHLPGIMKELKELGYKVDAINLGERQFPILEFFDRNSNELINTGLLYTFVAVTLFLGFLLTSEFISVGCLMAGAACCVVAMAKSIALAYDYLSEPTLENTSTCVM